MAPPTKKPVKRTPRKVEETRTRIVKIKAEIDSPAPPPKPPGGPLDKVLDLVKWVDSPFKLLTIIILGVLGLIGYIIYSHQDKLVASLTSRETMPELLADERLASLGRDLIRDLRAETVIIHQVDLAKNARITRTAQSADGKIKVRYFVNWNLLIRFSQIPHKAVFLVFDCSPYALFVG